VQRARLRVDTRKWVATKIAPRIYGDQIKVENTGEVTITQITRRVVDSDSRYQSPTVVHPQSIGALQITN
jgi:hypothetical protein